MTFKVGDQVVLRSDILARHSKTVPAYAGYTTAQFAWRELLGKLTGKVLTVSLIFENSKHINVKCDDKTLFPLGCCVGLDHTELELYDAVSN